MLEDVRRPKGKAAETCEYLIHLSGCIHLASKSNDAFWHRPVKEVRLQQWCTHLTCDKLNRECVHNQLMCKTIEPEIHVQYQELWSSQSHTDVAEAPLMVFAQGLLVVWSLGTGAKMI
jgi:hypothetical protein